MDDQDFDGSDETISVSARQLAVGRAGTPTEEDERSEVFVTKVEPPTELTTTEISQDVPSDKESCRDETERTASVAFGTESIGPDDADINKEEREEDTESSITTSTGNSDRPAPVKWAKWTQLTDKLHEANQKFVLKLALTAARNPFRCIVGIILLSFTLLLAGLATNFHINVEETEIYAPFDSLPRLHSNWYDTESGFEEATRGTILMIHNNGGNVLDTSAMKKVFEAVDAVRNTTGYTDVCRDGAYWDGYNQEFTCRIMSATRFWYHDVDLFDSQVQSEDDLIRQLSAQEFPGEVPVDHEYIMGNLQRDDSGNITYIPSFFVYIFLNDKGEKTLEFESAVLETLAALQDQWDQDNSLNLHLDYLSERSPSDEFRRAIEEDMFLLPIIFFVMSGFTCFVFFKDNRVQSRCLLGVGSVTTILMSLMTGFGALFIFGVPFTSMTQLLPFVVFGVGLDDTFIITGAYLRSDANLETEERIRMAMTEVGSSISVTTITTASAFLLGLTSSVPAIHWLCLYAWPTIIIDYLYQITFFVAILVLDERRIQANRKDIVICCKGNTAGAHTESGESPTSVAPMDTSGHSQHFADKVMAWYARRLLKPVSQVVVLGLFSTFFGYCIIRTTMLRQEFDVKALFPDGSYMISAMDSMYAYQERSILFHIFFRNEDQGDPAIQQQMISFVEEIQALPAFGAAPPLCWVRDLQRLQETGYYDVVEDMSFEEQIQFAMDIPAFKEGYGKDIVIDNDTGKITASRCTILAQNSFMDTVENQIDFLNDQRAVTTAQVVNQGKLDGQESFFTYKDIYLIWEFYNIAISELIMSTVLSIAAVSIITLIFIPHWSAVCFIIPMVSVVYIDLLGVMQLAGLDINAVTFVCLVISIGLIVDFLLHIMLRYVESKAPTREERVKETLETMGSSILLGGVSTLLGILPLAFSSSTIMRTVFTSLCSMVVLAVAHGLMVLPVLLSFFGPITSAFPDEPDEIYVEGNDESPSLEQGKGPLEQGPTMSPTMSDVTSPAAPIEYASHC
ncbi:Pick C1-like protein 1 [Seminavis robusta]|uniref:Pick C1-like protein 1 n=1 Tax=Seminavis robusta TaxID=568900 RepID=A0A9N8HGR0_9STRA|nr:Pick C1-like protein 1 [Seminavis robusta]|eukprot:Sro522_g159590.1 Pick C1-like protein 1 (1022) ;mRNA; f:35983-39354